MAVTAVSARKVRLRSGILMAVILAASVAGYSSKANAQIMDESRGVLTLSPMIERVTPAVVNISVRSRVEAQRNPLFNDPFFRRFFDDPQVPAEQEVVSAGSGVIVDAVKGYVLTNHHVIDKASEIQVTLRDRRTLKAKLIGSDAATDIALLQVSAGNLTAVPFGDSDHLKIGDIVVAMREAAANLVGRHDFSSFEAAGAPRASSVRTVRELTLERSGPFAERLTIEVEADGFLYNMVRNFVGTLVEVGRGKQPPAWVASVLAARDRTEAGPTAPPEGLFLVRVDYESS